MVGEEERRKILELLANGKITADEASSMLNAEAATAAVAQGGPAEPVEKQPKPAQDKPSAPAADVLPEEQAARQPSWLHVRVSDLQTGKRKVSVNMPLHLIKIGMKLGSGFAPELREVDWHELNSALVSGEKGILLEVEDEEDGEHVQIYVD